MWQHIYKGIDIYSHFLNIVFYIWMQYISFASYHFFIFYHISIFIPINYIFNHFTNHFSNYSINYFPNHFSNYSINHFSNYPINLFPNYLINLPTDYAINYSTQTFNTTNYFFFKVVVDNSEPSFSMADWMSSSKL